MYEAIRKARAEAVQSSAKATQKSLHLGDGPEQRDRDRKIKEAARGAGESPDMWADQSFQEFMWGTDVMRDTIIRWPEYEARIMG
jgi:salicylate hydroxylase